MKHTCPNHIVGCPGNIIRDGYFKRQEDSKLIQRLRCRSCGARFSVATNTVTYRQKKRRINSPLAKLLASNVSLRRSAWILRVNRKTVERKLVFLGQKYRRLNRRYCENKRGKIKSVQLDDLITKENSKLKPLAITLLVESESRRILALEVARIPAFGHLAKLAIKKYGKRPDEHPASLERLFQEFAPLMYSHAIIKSDEHQRYGTVIKKYLPHAKHLTFKSERARVAGQGELKKGGFDPIFMVNHSCAMLRANVSRLIRKTWITTKRVDRLKDHLEIFLWFYNQKLLPPSDLTPI